MRRILSHEKPLVLVMDIHVSQLSVSNNITQENNVKCLKLKEKQAAPWLVPPIMISVSMVP